MFIMFSSTVMKLLKHNDGYFKLFNSFHEGNRVDSQKANTSTRVDHI